MCVLKVMKRYDKCMPLLQNVSKYISFGKKNVHEICMRALLHARILDTVPGCGGGAVT